MSRFIIESSKTPTTGYVPVDTSSVDFSIQIITNSPTSAYPGNFDLYTVDGLFSKMYFNSAIIFSNDSSSDLIGLEDQFTPVYSTSDVAVYYVYFTTLLVDHNVGRTAILIPGYQTSIGYTVDGTTTIYRTPDVITNSTNSYYKVNCIKLCYDDGNTANSYMFYVRPPLLATNYLAINSSVYTNAQIGAVAGHNFMFNFASLALDSNSVVYVDTSNNELEITLPSGNDLILKGLGATISSLTSDMIIT